MRVGLDFDGTIILYDRLFHEAATQEFGMPANVPVRKEAIRSWMRENEPGEAGWCALQRVVYGIRIAAADPAPGVDGFLRTCRELNVSVSVISHKTEFSAAAPPVDLRRPAIAWLQQRAFFEAAGYGLRAEDVFFESTRVEKLARIAAEGCDLFVDDLEEVLREPAFPAGVERWLYAPGGSRAVPSGVRAFSDWSEATARVREIAEAPRGS